MDSTTYNLPLKIPQPTLQVFKEMVPDEIVLNFLLKICINNNNNNNNNIFVLSKVIFKKALLFNNIIIPEFIETIKPYYYPCKSYFINRQLTYNNFITIMKQLCNNNSEKFNCVSKKIYNNSKYEIEYTISYKVQ
jgi:hypothetical protein